MEFLQIISQLFVNNSYFKFRILNTFKRCICNHMLLLEGIIELIDFVVPPQIVPFDFGDEPINSGDVTSVLCTANKGDFPLKITWTLNGHSIDKFKGIAIFQNNKRSSQLSIDYVQAEHSGTFLCNVTNPAGTTSHEAVLLVNGIFCLLINVMFANIYAERKLNYYYYFFFANSFTKHFPIYIWR